MRMYLSAVVRIKGKKIRYFLLEETQQPCRYGICVTDGEDTVAVRDVSGAADEVQRLLRAMARGRVTPCTVRDVAEDWICAGHGGL